ncbi:MAG: PP2C family protein-serine/threonine phosphatase [Bacteroidota bacterium]
MNERASSRDHDHSRFELRTILDTSRLLIESHDPNFVLNNLLLITMGKLLITKGLVLTYQPWSSNYTVDCTKGPTGLTEGDEITLDWDDRYKEQAVIQVADEDLSLPPALRKKGFCTFLNLRTSNHHIGFLVIGPKLGQHELTQHELEFIESLAIISAVAISNSRMITELKRINRKLDRKVYELNTLFDLSKDFNMMVDRDQIIRVFKFAMLGQMLIRKFFFILEREEEREVVTTSGITDPPDPETVDQFFEFGDDVQLIDEQLSEEFPFLKEHDIQAIIALRFQDDKLAVIGVGPRANNEGYSESDYNFLSSLGNLALLSIQKTFLLEERIEKGRLEEELNIAQTIQEGLLPDPLPEVPDLQIAARNISSHQVGGDYFDIIPTPQKNVLFAIADVTGKGMPAALLMANLQAMLHTLTPLDITLSEATERINDIIFENTPSNKFITFFWGSYNPELHRLRYVNAGHNPPLLFHQGQDEPEELTEGGMILGAMATMMPYEQAEITIEDGDLLVLYTDGVTEAMSAEEEEYGEERLLKCLQDHRDQDPERILQAVVDDILDFSEGIQHDDITLVVVKAKVD